MKLSLILPVLALALAFAFVFAGAREGERAAPQAGAAARKVIAAHFDEANARAVATWLERELPQLVERYKFFHANPELSLQEHKTAKRIAGSLKDYGYEVTEDVGGAGVVAVMKNGEGPTILIRGDIDALPVVEETGLPYASQVKVKAGDGTAVGVMHACGHDVHITMVLGVGKALAEMRNRWSGTVVMIAQPAEEVGKGARMMIADGLFNRFPAPDLCLALHVQHDKPAGWVGYKAGWAAANVDSVDITIFGKGGHGAKPHSTVDPIIVAAHTITSLQTLVSRRVDPIEPAVVTVGSIHGGTKHNIISDEVKMQLTVRSYTDEVQLLDGIRQMATDTAASFQCPKPPEVIVKDEYTPTCYNSPELTKAAASLFRKLLGADKVYENPPTMGGEDFGTYARTLKVPGLQYSVGSISREKYEASQKPGAGVLPSLHSALYAPDPEPTIRTSVETMTNLALGLFGKK